MRIIRSGRPLRGVLAAAAFLLGGFSATALAVPVVALQGGTTLVFFDSQTPNVIVATRAIAGLQSETLVAIDRRPATGALYGLSSAGRIYLINPNDGGIQQIGSTPLTLSGTAFGMDFNPTVDRIRIVSDTGQNLRAHPETGALVSTDGPLNGAATGAVGAAYTNNFAGATTTTLFDINSATDALYTQNPPNAGTLVLMGSLGVDTSSAVSFDITSTGQALALLTVGGTVGLYSINLITGAATLIGTGPAGVIGATAIGGFPVGGIATNVPTLSGYALAALAGLLALFAAFVLRRRAIVAK